MTRKQPPRVLVHIVTYNNEQTIAACIESVLSQESLEPWHNVFLYVTDNNSSDATVEIIESQFNGHLRLKKNDSNKGFATAHNEAISFGLHYGVDFIFLLNPDVRLEPTALNRLLEALRTDTRAGTACPKLLRSDETLSPVSPELFDSTGMFMTPALRHFDRGSNEATNNRYTNPEYVFGGSGAAILLRTNFVRDVALSTSDSHVELFDDAFFAYREDADLAWRSLLLGWKCRYVPDAVGYHQRKVLPENRSEVAEAINRCSVRNRFLLQANNFSWGANWHCIIPAMLRNLLVIGAALSVEPASRPALGEAFHLLPGALIHRRRLLTCKRISSVAASRWFAPTPYAEPAISLTTSLHKVSSVAVVIVNYNSDKRLVRCLEAILAEDESSAHMLSIIVVDNASTDGSAAHAADIYSRRGNVKFIHNTANLGFAGAINQAIENIAADAVLILNPDVEISPQNIAALTRALDTHANIAAVAPILTSRNGEPQIGFTARRFPTLAATLAELFFIHRLWPTNPWTTSYQLKDDSFVEQYITRSEPGAEVPAENPKLPLVVDQPAGAALLVRSAVFRELRGFDAAFWPAWFEDVDFCKRLRDVGYVAAIYQQATAIHEGGYSVKTLSRSAFARAWYPNLSRYWRKHGSRTQYALISVLLPLALLFRGIAYFIDGMLPNSTDNSRAKEKLSLSKTLFSLALSKNS